MTLTEKTEETTSDLVPRHIGDGKTHPVELLRRLGTRWRRHTVVQSRDPDLARDLGYRQGPSGVDRWRDAGRRCVGWAARGHAVGPLWPRACATDHRGLVLALYLPQRLRAELRTAACA